MRLDSGVTSKLNEESEMEINYMKLFVGSWNAAHSIPSPELDISCWFSVLCKSPYFTFSYYLVN